MCIVNHNGHDFILADEIASFEIKQALKATVTECAYKIKSQNMLFNETEKLAQYIEDIKLQEFEKIHYYFMDLHKELEKREAQLKEIYYEQVKDVESILKKDLEILNRRMKEFEDISFRLNEKSNRFRMSNDLAIVANAHEIFELQRKVKNNNFEGKRLELDEENELLESNKLEESPDEYNYKPKKKLTEQSSSFKPKPKTDEQNENTGEHVFFVQLDSELPMPHFLINISKEKKKIEGIGSIKNSFLSNQQIFEEPQESERTKMASEAAITTPYKNSRIPYRKQHEVEMKQFLDNYNGLSSSFRAKISQDPSKVNMYQLGYNSRVVDPSDLPPAPVQSIIIKEETMVKSDLFMGREMYWFKWDSYDVWRYSFPDDMWSLVEDARPPHKFLYFSNNIHLKHNLGSFILGGCDFEENYSKRTLYFENYTTFKEKAQMISTRAFFAS